MGAKSIVLIQPPLLQSSMEVDVIQQRYWEVLRERIDMMLAQMGLNRDFNESSGNFTGFIEPNIGLLYVAAVLKNNGYSIRYVDAHILDSNLRNDSKRVVRMEDIEAQLREIPKEELSLVAISPLTVNFGWAVQIAEAVKRLNDKAVVVVGGVHAAFEYENILRKHECIDIISVGEGEDSTVELGDALYANGFRLEGLEGIKGFAYRKDGGVHFTGHRPFIRDLDTVPYPLYELLPKEVLDHFMIRVMTSRGCTNNCSFCVPSKFFNRLRFRDPVKVVDEIHYYYDTYGWQTYMIGDLNFLSNYEHAARFCREIIERKLEIVWMCQARVDLIDPDIVSLMKQAGCIMICMGIESAGQDILNNSQKDITLERCMEACRTVKEAGIGLFTFWVFGLPGETHESAHATIKLMRKLIDDQLVDYTHCTTCVPFPGTDLYRNPDKYKIKILNDDFDQYWMGCDYLGAGLPVMETEELSNYEIYAYWQMALAVVAGNLMKNKTNENEVQQHDRYPVQA